MSKQIHGKKIAILATDGFEQDELTGPKGRIEEAGGEVTVLSVDKTPKEIKGWNHTDWGAKVKVNGLVSHANPADFDALVLPGGQMNPDKLRINKAAVDFVRRFAETGKPIAAICHAPWLLIEAGLVRGRRMTSWPSVRTDLINAGANWVDEEAVEDGQFITSRWPDDIPAFSDTIIDALYRAEPHARAA